MGYGDENSINFILFSFTCCIYWFFLSLPTAQNIFSYLIALMLWSTEISITRHKKHWFNVYCRHHQLQDLHNFETSNSVCIIECEAKNDSCVIGQHCDNNLIHIMYALCITILHYRIISSSKYCRVRLEWVSEFSSVFWRLHKVQCLVFEHELQEVHHLEFSGFSKACIHILAKICLLSTTKSFN